MPTLPELQRAFTAAVYADDHAVVEHVRPGKFPATRYLRIYRNNVFANLTAALKAVYPVIERLVGRDFFGYSADTYIRHNPPTRGYLHDFGRHFPEFLAGFEPARKLVYLPDVAHLEWARHHAFHAADAAMLSLASLATVPPARHGTLRFSLHPSAQLVVSDYPILRIWQVNQPGHTDDARVDLAMGGVRLLVVRRAQDVVIETLTTGDHALLSAFAAEQSFETAGRAALVAQPEYQLAAALRRYVASATLTNFFLPEMQCSCATTLTQPEHAPSAHQPMPAPCMFGDLS